MALPLNTTVKPPSPLSARHSAARRAFPDNLTIHFEAPALRAESPPHAPYNIWGYSSNQQTNRLRLYSMIPCCQKSLLSNETIVTCPHWATKKQQSYNFLLLILCYLTIATILYIFNSLFVLGSSSVKYTNNEKSNMPLQCVYIHPRSAAVPNFRNK